MVHKSTVVLFPLSIVDVLLWIVEDFWRIFVLPQDPVDYFDHKR